MPSHDLAEGLSPACASVLDARGAWHWPNFTGVLCGTLNDRERLGLPDHYQPDVLHESLPQTLNALRGASMSTLFDLLEDAGQALVVRYAAGQLLACIGDPRLVTRRPAMIDIPGGEVRIGLDEACLTQVLQRYHGLGLDADWIRKECPRHPVVLAPYRIARYPVTNQEYLEFLRATGYRELPSSWTFRRFPRERANHPVYTLSAPACDAYVAWLAETTGRDFRLPSEAEWEYAAAGPQGLEFPWGEGFDASRANCAETGIFDTTPVGMFGTGHSPFGVADLAGNVEEYVADDYSPYPGGKQVDDHLQQIHGRYRIARGGSFARFRDLARTRRRHGHNPRSPAYVMGFRIAETP